VNDVERNMEISKLLSDVEKEPKKYHEFLRKIDIDELCKVDIIGVFGSSGSGKSSLIGKLAKLYRDEEKKVGIIAIDPTSSKSGGAFLGDRIRMRDLFEDHGVFIRSVSEKNTGLGLNSSIFSMVFILASNGFEKIFVETVGSGQTSVDITSLCDLSLLVISPGSGDEIQFMKAGGIEQADILVLNKSDLPEFEFLELELRNAMIQKRTVRVSTIKNENVDLLKDEIEVLLSKRKKSVGYCREKMKKRLKKHVELILFENLRKVLSSIEFDLSRYDVEMLRSRIVEDLYFMVKNEKGG